MSFLLSCPNCGPRPVGEFTFRGEVNSRPEQDDGFEAWTNYVFMSNNTRGKRDEWWYHGSGCHRWFIVNRDTTCNTDHDSRWYGEVPE